MDSVGLLNIKRLSIPPGPFKSLHGLSGPHRDSVGLLNIKRHPADSFQPPGIALRTRYGQQSGLWIDKVELQNIKRLSIPRGPSSSRHGLLGLFALLLYVVPLAFLKQHLPSPFPTVSILVLRQGLLSVVCIRTMNGQGATTEHQETLHPTRFFQFPTWAIRTMNG